MLTFTLIFLTALFISTAIDFWLEQRQRKAVLTHRHEVPARFKDVISLEAHQKAADYTATKIKVGTWAGIYSLGLLLMWTLGGGLDVLDEIIRQWGWSELTTGVVFILLFSFIGSLLDLPFSIYNTFVVEEKFGFNKMTAKLFITDMVKGALLMTVIAAPLIWVILWLMQSAGNLWWLWAWAVWVGFSLLMMWAYPTFIAPLFNKFEPMKNQELKQAIEGLLQRCGFESNGLFQMDGSKRSSHGNAYFTGFGKSKRIVFYDTLLEQLSTNETLAVLAHELGHFKRNHIKKRMLVTFTIFLAGFAIMGWLAEQTWFYEGLGVSHPSNHMLLVLFMLVMPVFTFFISPIMSMYSRKHEFEADDYAKEHAEANDLISALVKMYEDNAATLTPDPLYSAWHDSHPPAPIRIAHLEK
ncbi:M48 family metallopeptidase [Ghiorsea bivora]|uniref:M48 family metallopeptidase n=1 Tax=Ghiorsea bivora TaxID=1485545 RepID=UPI0005706547|nr:M48 family metallopeptidase [Ghiorsea bivora]